ncbi:MAG TPA: nucleoside hydrolase [Gemmatimonadales bacterium]|jgi:inosine-uridine nucleoside N-ribohydrolase
MDHATPLVVDTDPGIDDALALLLAVRWRKCRLLAVTTTFGNHYLDTVTRNARLILDRGPSAAPVTPGADRPLKRELIVARETHGKQGLGDLDAPAAPAVRASSDALHDVLESLGGPVTLITLGPLTNLAHALHRDAALVRSRVTKHVAMGGNIAAPGNTGPHSEFNVWCDPEAAGEVFSAGLKSEMVGLDVTRQLVLPAASVEKLAAHSDPDAQWLGKLLGFYVRFHQAQEGLAGAVINDPLAIALALEPGWGETESFPLTVDLGDGPDRGRTTAGGAAPPVKAYRAFDHAMVHDLLLEHLFGRWLTRADFRP